MLSKPVDGRRFGVAILLIVVLSILCRRAAADSINLHQGQLSLQTTLAYANGMERRNEALPSIAAGVNYFVMDNLSLGLEVSGLRAIQDGDDAWMAGISLTLHHHLFRFDRYTIFGDVSFGPVESDEQVPHDGTQFNFITRTGIGATVRINEDLHLVGGVRYFHLSNARIEGVERNPSINGIEGYVGLMWMIR